MWTDLLVLMKQEIAIAAIIFLLLILQLGKDRGSESYIQLVNILLLLNFAAGFIGAQEGNLFGSMFQTSQLVVMEKNILNLAMLLISLQSYDWLKTHRHVPEFYVLLLSSLLGMFFMISSGNLLMFYLGLELSTIPLAAAANFDLLRKRSSEAAMKLIFSSAFASALMLFGISLIYGTTGTLNFAEITPKFSTQPLQLFAFVLLLAGFGFKISAAPFHLWTADVYEGAPTGVTAFLSVISKAAVLFVLVSVLYKVFGPLSGAWYNMLYVLALLTIITGNLFAMRQQNLKRFLAFSSIAQVGFILVGISGSSQAGAASVVYFVLIYVFSNLAAFGVVALVSSLTGREGIADYKGLYRSNPVLAWILAIALFSLAGVPPAAGFFGKFFLLLAGAGKGNYILISIAALNMVISFYYYLKVVKAMFMEENAEPMPRLTISLMPRLALYGSIAGVLVTGFAPYMYDYIHSLSKGF